MSRLITLVSAQWADLPLKTLAQKVSQWGFDGLELDCNDEHFDIDKILAGDISTRAALDEHGLKCFAIGAHRIGQCVCDDPIDERHRRVLSDRLWGDGSPEGVRQRSAAEMKRVAQAARVFGAEIVTGFTGSSIWKNLYFFPPTSQDDVQKGFADFAARWMPILDVFAENGVRFALEVHPTEIAYDILTAQCALEAVDFHPAFGFNFDPSHLIPQMVNPVEFIRAFPERIFHVHIKDARLQLDGRASILGSHLDFGNPQRGWDFVSPGRGDVKWDSIIRALNHIGYAGPLSVEWEDNGMEREWGAREALEMIRKQDFEPSKAGFDSVFAKRR
ncbi:MAG: sugar phosphate isomerase/epimerase family protein [Chloroflexota bacterium]